VERASSNAIQRAKGISRLDKIKRDKNKEEITMMNRRQFGLLSTASLAAGVVAPSAQAQAAAPDASLLKTTLTPFGAERAGNADGSIPPWTGGIVSPPLPPNQPVQVMMFNDDKPIYTINAGNMAQYASLLTEGTADLITKFGFRMEVHKTIRSAAAPQYVYDNTAQNVTRAKLETTGGRFGFTGGYGGPPFPIPDTSDPYVAGAQLIWNHLVSWSGYSLLLTYGSSYVVTSGGKVVLTSGLKNYFVYPYYDPDGSLETYEGYFYKLHSYTIQPASSNGQETIVWHTSNSLVKSDIVWSLLNGQGRVRKDPNEAYDTPSPLSNGLSNFDDGTGFYGSPQKYDWKLISKQEMLIPYNNNVLCQTDVTELVQPAYPNPDLVRWEKHRVWVVEATLHPGENNVTARRRVYIDEDTLYIVLSDMYDRNNTLVKTMQSYNRCIPSVPVLIASGYALWDMLSGAYTLTSPQSNPPYTDNAFFMPIDPSKFEAEEMAANASF
jgi:hypothetical protein